MTADEGTAPFRYDGWDTDPAAGLVTCRYSLGELRFREEFTFSRDGAWDSPAVAEAVRLLHLLAGVSYYKTRAPLVVDLGDTPVREGEREFLREFHVEGLGEFAYRNGLDLTGLEVVGGGPPPAPTTGPAPAPGRPLVPFGGGMDSTVSVELLRERAAADGEPFHAALFVLARPGDRYEAIERPAAVTGLPVVRAGRRLDPQVLRSAELGFRNGHVPVTGIVSAAALVAAALEGRDAVVMSNEWSASAATLTVAGRGINHQWSKGERFESLLRGVLAAAGPAMPGYFSLLRARSELWIGERFASYPQYLHAFRSCNRAFHVDPARRLDHWCGHCDKCAFVDLALAPYVPAAELARVFDGDEPLARESMLDVYRRLLALTPDAKPWECVGDETECRVAARLAAARPDRQGQAVLAGLVAESAGHADPDPAALLLPLAQDHVPPRYRPVSHHDTDREGARAPDPVVV